MLDSSFARCAVFSPSLCRLTFALLRSYLGACYCSRLPPFAFLFGFPFQFSPALLLPLGRYVGPCDSFCLFPLVFIWVVPLLILGLSCDYCYGFSVIVCFVFRSRGSFSRYHSRPLTSRLNISTLVPCCTPVVIQLNFAYFLFDLAVSLYPCGFFFRPYYLRLVFLFSCEVGLRCLHL